MNGTKSPTMIATTASAAGAYAAAAALESVVEDTVLSEGSLFVMTPQHGGSSLSGTVGTSVDKTVCYHSLSD